MKQLYRLSLVAMATVMLVGCHNKVQSSHLTAQQEAALSQSTTYGIGPDGQYAGDESRLQAPQNQTYYFAFDSSSIAPRDIPAIEAQASYLVKHRQAKVRIEGHTDSRGSREYNIALGWQRAQSVQHILELNGVSAKQIAVVSYGKERPIVKENNEEAWGKNRRVNLIYEAK